MQVHRCGGIRFYCMCPRCASVIQACRGGELEVEAGGSRAELGTADVAVEREVVFFLAMEQLMTGMEQ